MSDSFETSGNRLRAECHLTEAQRVMMQSRCEDFDKEVNRRLGNAPQTSVAKTAWIDTLVFSELLHCLEWPGTTALIRSHPAGYHCLIEVSNELVKSFCGSGTRTYDLNTEEFTFEERDPDTDKESALSRAIGSRCFSAPPRVVFVANANVAGSIVPVLVAGVVPSGLYEIILQAWKHTWREIPHETFETVGYNLERAYLEHLFTGSTGMLLFGADVRIGDRAGFVNVSIPLSTWGEFGVLQ